MFRKKVRKYTDVSSKKLTMKLKLILSLSSIAVILLVSSIMSVMEYRRMSNYVSDLMAEDINSVTLAQSLADDTNRFNLEVLTVIGDDSISSVPYYDEEGFMAHCDSLRNRSLASTSIVPLADSVVYAYSAYMLTALELPKVVQSDFIDSRIWYFERLQPKYNRLRGYIDQMNEAVYNDLKKNSETFDNGFYRSIIPGIVAVGVGFLLLLMLLFFILSYYVNPINKMLSGLSNYRSYSKRYSYSFDGDDQLVELNDGITQLSEENIRLKKRIAALRSATGYSGPAGSGTDTSADGQTSNG